MAITQSIGYEGTVDYDDLTRWLPYVGSGRYGVVDDGWRPTEGTGARELRVGSGWGFGYGVIDYNDANASVFLPSVSSGQQWFMVVAKRDWTTKVTSFAYVSGSAAKVLPSRVNNPADEDDQPVALCRVVADSSDIAEIVDLRVWRGHFARDVLVREYYNEIGARVRIGNSVHERVLGADGNPAWLARVVGDTVWTDIAQRAGFSDGGSVYKLGFATVPGGAILRGYIEKNSGLIAGGDQVGTLPALARPKTNTRSHALTTNLTGQAAILRTNATGAIVLDKVIGNSVGPTWISLDGWFIPRDA